MAKDKVQPTLADIAAHSGVSAATVSRVLNRSGSVSKALAAKVNQSLRVLGFQQTIQGYLAILVPDVGALTVTDKLTGVYAEAERLGYTVVPLHVGSSKEITERNFQLLKIIGFDALIILKDQMDPEALREDYQLGSMPIIMLSQTVNVPNVHSIDTNRVSGMYKAVRYLISLGHERIAYMSAPLETETARARKRGIERAMEEAGLHESCFTFRQGASSIENGFQMTGTLLHESSDDKPTAIVAYDDLVAIGCLHALNTYGVRVPKDISVVGFDDLFITDHTNPPLTTVHQPWHKMGQLAVTKIHNILAGRDTDHGGLTILECPLIVRESTGPAPRGE